MQFLGYSWWLTGCCYAVSRVFWVVARVLLCSSRVFLVVARVVICSF